MDKTNDAINSLYHYLMETMEAYEAIYNRGQETELGDAISNILSRREENIAELERFLSEEGVEPDASAHEQLGDVSTPTDVLSMERNILDAYDKAIVPITDDNEKYRFLVDQYEWLKDIVDTLAEGISPEIPI